MGHPSDVKEQLTDKLSMFALGYLAGSFKKNEPVSQLFQGKQEQIIITLYFCGKL